MCELMSMSFARPISADFSIREFALRSEENADGWGLAWYPDKSVAVVKEPVKWQASPYTSFLESYRGLHSRLYIAHVRLRTMGGEKPSYADTHPFVRELAGREYAFAHNGTLSRELWQLPIDRFRPVGKTDSEYLFCHLLGEIAGWPDQLAEPANWPRLHDKFKALNTLGKLNLILADGKRLCCYYDEGGWKGMVYRQIHIRGSSEGRHFEDANLEINVDSEPINFGMVVATSPLSPTGWTHLHKGELMVLQGGLLRWSSHRPRTSVDGNGQADAPLARQAEPAAS